MAPGVVNGSMNTYGCVNLRQTGSVILIWRILRPGIHRESFVHLSRIFVVGPVLSGTEPM
jgi:hypothetical protein